jgi:hypothetical protein
MNALQREQITFQRQSQRQAQAAAIMEGLSTLSSQLHPLITASIDCTQEANDEITCLPEPQENERLLIIQFFQLAIQAHRLGITGNPVTMDFGDALEVSVLLR